MLNINDKKIEEIKNAKAEKRVELMYIIAEILNGKVIDKYQFSKTSKYIKIDNYKINLTTKKVDGKVIVKELDITDEEKLKNSNIHDGIWKTIKIN